MPTHTKGPWRVEIHDKRTSVESDVFTICDDVSNNDADLIAAAPELLEALKKIHRRLRADLSTSELCMLADIAAAAIFKSGG